jgi:hypothetical protein
MKDLKLELFKFKNNLTIEQLEISKIINDHLEIYEKLSEKEIYNSLNKNLFPYSYFSDVKTLVESIKNEIESKPLVYELKDLYKKIERTNNGMLYRTPLLKVMEIINLPDDDSRMEHILNELNIYDWVPEIKGFLLNLTTNPIERQNLKNTGKADKVFTIVEKCDDGHLTYIGDRWFLISEKEIKQVLAEDYIKDNDKVRNIRLLEQILKISNINNDIIEFDIDENLTIGVSLKNKDIFLNEEKLDKETTIETIFNSPIIPYLKREYYVLVESTLNNIDKFMDLDITLKINNLINPFNESYVFNYKDKMYVYSIDSRYGSKFYVYENAMELIHDIKKEFDYDLTHFYENKVSDEVKNLRSLEDKEQQIKHKLDDINESIEILKDNEELMKEDKELKNTFDQLLICKRQLIKKINNIYEQKNIFRKKIVE